MVDAVGLVAGVGALVEDLLELRESRHVTRVGVLSIFRGVVRLQCRRRHIIGVQLCDVVQGGPAVLVAEVDGVDALVLQRLTCGQKLVQVGRDLDVVVGEDRRTTGPARRRPSSGFFGHNASTWRWNVRTTPGSAIST